jgi:hypothetical protein
MDKVEIANNLVKLHSDYQEIASRYGDSIKAEYSKAVAQAILLLTQAEGEGENDG